MSTKSIFVSLVLAFSLCAVAPLFGQIEVGRVTGTVTDQTGAVVNGATVTLTNNNTGVVATEATADGVYAFPAVQPGTYTVRIESTGFATQVTNNVVIHVQQTNTVDARLTPGKVTEQVVVSTAAPLLQTETASVGQTINSIQVDNMPLNGRQWSSLGMLAAGVNTAQPGYSNNGATGNPSSTYYSVNGQALGSNDFRLNGVSDMATFFNANAIIQPPPEAIEEFKIETGDYSAEFGHGIAGVINAVVKSGTNQLHGDLFEYFRNNALDAKDYFTARQDAPLPELRQNQFGGTIGGPIYIPHLYDGRNKSFFFFDYQELKSITPGNQYLTTVPSTLMQSSNFTNLQDLITASTGTSTDALGRTFPNGTVFDPATTRQIAAGAVDSITGLQNTSTGSIDVRDPFYSGSLVGMTNFTAPAVASQLNMLPANRIDPNALKLLQLFPAPNTTANYFAGNYFKNTNQTNTSPQVDLRIDHNFGAKDLISGFYSWSKQSIFLPQDLPGVLDGTNAGGTTNTTSQSVSGSYTHVFSPTLTNEIRVGYTKQNLAEEDPLANTLGIPAQFGIPGIPQFPGNGGLPVISIGNLASIGVSPWSPGILLQHDLQIIDNITKIHGKHVLKMGVDINSLEGDILQPPWGRGNFDFNGSYTNIPNGTGPTGIAQFLLTPIASTVGGPNFVGGSDSITATSASYTNDHRWYNGVYFEDAYKVTPTLTLDLGLRYDLFTPYQEDQGLQANLIANGGNGPGGAYYIPESTCGYQSNPAFEQLLSTDGIKTVCSSGLGTGTYGKKNFAPRVGFAKRITPKYVLRAGFGIAYSSLDSIGYGPNVGQNYPFYYVVGYNAQNTVTPLRFPNPSTGTYATLENGLSPITPASIDPEGLELFSRYPFAQQTPYTETYNLSNQYEITHNDSIQVAYVGSVSRHLTSIMGMNLPTQLLLPGTSLVAQTAGAPNFIPFPDFAEGSSLHTTTGVGAYNSAQVVYEHRFSSGLQALANYVFARCLTDGGPQETGLNTRALFLPGFGQRAEYSNCVEAVTHTVHFSGTYQLPFGAKMHWQGNRATNAVLGNWQLNWIYTYQSGNFFGIRCTQATTSGMGCSADVTGDPYAGARTISHWLNASAFSNPTIPTAADADANGVLFNQQDFALLGTSRNYSFEGPSFYNVDFSIFKDFHLGESKYFQFRAEAFNMLNNPQFDNPSDGNFTSDPNFGQITGVRNTGREVQLALKFYY